MKMWVRYYGLHLVVGASMVALGIYAYSGVSATADAVGAAAPRANLVFALAAMLAIALVLIGVALVVYSCVGARRMRAVRVRLLQMTKVGDR